jgi:uncharacterized protein (DUF362 family)
MNSPDTISHIDRRTFLRILSFTGITGLVYPAKLFSHLMNPFLSRIVIAMDSSATSGITINASTSQIMMDASIKALTDIQDVGEAWKSLFANIDLTKNIAIKVNCINSSVPSHPEVTFAVTNGLQQMEFNGTPFPANNIIIFDQTGWELTSAGYTLNTGSSGVRCFGTNASGVGYGSQSHPVNGSNQRISKIYENYADYVINLSVLKNHSTAGVTLCMKNHYGTCQSPGSLHGNHADPYIPALNALPVITNKQVLNICDALLGVVSGGPGGSPQIAPNTIIMSQDIVATDYWGRQILEENGCGTINRAHHVDTAAGAPYNLGTNDPSQMDVIYVNDPVSKIPNDGNNPHNVPTGFYLQQNYPNPFNNRTQLKFFLPRQSVTRLEIFDTYGRKVRLLLNNNLSQGWHQFSWAGENDSGTNVASGIYLARLTSGDFQKAIIMTLAK